jgi:hypothetical protein
MSTEEDKVKHSKRLHRDNSAIAKQVKIAKAHGVHYKEPHKFAKHHAMDCGSPGCALCGNPRKIFKEETKQEQSFKQTSKWDGE